MNPRKSLDQLFVSKVRIKALHYFYTHPNEPIHLRGAVRELNEEINAVRRELERMEAVNMVKSIKKGNRKYFSLNPDFVFYDELLAMVYKSYGLGFEIISKHKKIGAIKFAVLAQGYTRSVPIGKNKIDLVIVGDDLNMREITKIVEQDEKRIGRDIYYAVLDQKDFGMRKARRDVFMQELVMQELVVLIGDTIKLTEGIHG